MSAAGESAPKQQQNRECEALEFAHEPTAALAERQQAGADAGYFSTDAFENIVAVRERD